MARVTRKYLESRLARLASLLGRTDLEFEIWSPGDRHGTRYQVKAERGARDMSGTLTASGMEDWLDGATKVAELFGNSGEWSVAPGRGLVRDGVEVAYIGNRALRPVEADELAHTIARALNRTA